MKKYFVYELKKSLLPIGIITVISTLLYLVCILTSYNLGQDINSLYLPVIAFTGGALAAFVPVWVFSYKMKKRSVDLYYSLPVSHTKILTVKFLLGLIAVFAPYTIAYWIGAFTVMAKAYELINAQYYAAHFFSSVIPVYIIYAISAFVFTRANRLEDGILFIIFWAFAITAIAFALYIILEFKLHDTIIFPADYLSAAPLGTVTVAFQSFIPKECRPFIFINAEKINMIIGFGLNTLLAAGATVGIFLSEKYAKSESVGQISESPFGYKTMIPLYTVCLSPFMWQEVITGVLLCIFSYLLTVIYRRTVKIGKRQAVIYAASVAAGWVLYAVSIIEIAV